MQFLYDNHGPYKFIKIYFPENITNEYDLFDRNQNDLQNFTSPDSVNNFMPNTQQNQLPSFQQHIHQPKVPLKPPPTNVIHHLVSSLGPNKTGSYSPFGETIINNSTIHVEIPHSMDPNTSSIQTTTSPLVQNSSSANNREVKKRIVAEVKPMRMSYSDVVSKNGANQSPNSSSSHFGNTNSASSSPNTTLPVTSKNVKVDKSKFSSFDKKLQEDKAKRSPINSNTSNNSNSVHNQDRKSPVAIHSTKISQTPLNHHQKKKFNLTSKTPLNNTTTNARDKFDSDSDDSESELENEFELDDDTIGDYYNVRSYHNVERISSSKNTTSYKKVKVTKTEPSMKKSEKLQKRSGKNLNRKRQKHEVLIKLCMAWMEYLLKFVKWLWILIYDVFYLSCGIIWDRLSWCYQCTEQGLASVRNELSRNPGKTAWLWLKSNWTRFDAKFDKKSKWAFWRWMFKKKLNNLENSKEFFKDGKLPKTAEEAMKSLLNCKGKDAYR
jgi:DnaJ homolog subfamily C member 14